MARICADETGQWHASDELVDDVLAVKSGADSWAVGLLAGLVKFLNLAHNR